MVAKGAVDSEAKPDLYVYEYPLPTPRGGGMGAMASGRNSMPGHIRLGITSTDADFIRRQARVQLGVSGIAIVLMIGLSYYFLRTLQRFVALQAREDAERHLRSLGTMAATLAHEIRNPLGAMKGLTQLAQEGLPGSHSAQPMMNTVVSEAERLERLVTDLLTFAKPPQPQFVRFDVAGLLADLKSMLQGQLEDAHVVLEIDAAPVPLEIESDDSGLRQVLLNVIFNALDVSPRNSKIRVRAGLISSGRELVLDVEDSGPGLGDRDSEELFQPFATTKTHGTGLGLAVSRRIINSLGGSLTLASRPEGGARCSIRIPVARANSPDQ
jgi:two-component system sensor histidine kinase HydH